MSQGSVILSFIVWTMLFAAGVMRDERLNTNHWSYLALFFGAIPAFIVGAWA
jgi:hypothetical protein